MKRIGMLLAATLVVAGCSDNTEDEGWRTGYSIGYKMGQRFSEEMKDLDLDAFNAGMRAAYAGDKETPKLTDEEMQAAIQAYQEKRIAQVRDEMKQKADANKAAADTFLAENGKRAGVVTTASGLQYEVLAQGTGATPKATDIVKARYHGTLPDGTVFDSTRERGDEPAEFPLNRVIPAWTEGVQLMNKGAKYKLFVPPQLGYGERGAGGKIGPNQALVFEVELVDFYPPGGAPKGK